MSALIQPRRKLLIAARPYDLSDAMFDGFVDRHLRIVERLGEDYSLTVLVLRPPSDSAEVSSRVPGSQYLEVGLHRRGSGRGRRLAQAAAALTSWPAFPEVEAALEGVDADAAVTIGPWLTDEYRPVFAAYPTVHLFEEDLSSMPEIAPQSARARAFRGLETCLRGRARLQPQVVVTIALSERASAKRLYRRAAQLTIPFALSASEWPLATEPSPGSGVLVVGQLAQPRNSEGLVEILREFAQRGLSGVAIHAVSGAGFHPDLAPFIREGMLVPVAPTGSLYDLYRRYAVCIVPAKRVTGLKTTVLQAFTAGCAVVCYDRSAQTLGRAGQLIGGIHDASSAVDRLVELLGDQDARIRQVRSFAPFLRADFDEEFALQRLLAAVESMTGSSGTSLNASPGLNRRTATPE